MKGTGSQGVGVHKLRKGDGDGLLLAQVADGFTVDGRPAKTVGVSTAAGKTPLGSWDPVRAAEGAGE